MKLEHLKTIKKIISHENCPDGKASALLCNEVLPQAEIEFVQYQTPRHKAIEPEPGVLFVDFTPWAERELTTAENKNPPLSEAGKARIQAWVDAGAVVLDHHKGAADVVAMFGERGVFADEKERPGVSGAVLAYEEVFLPLLAKRKISKEGKAKLTDKAVQLASLAGIRDTWQQKSPDWTSACQQAAALVFWPWERLLAAGVRDLERLLEIGPVILERDRVRDEKTINESYSFEFEGKKVICFEGTHTSDIADRVEADLVIGWHYLRESDGLKMVFSCRSRGDFSALDFAKAYGGGGHFHAAGFKMPITKENTAGWLVPYACVELLVGKYLAPEKFPAVKTQAVKEPDVVFSDKAASAVNATALEPVEATVADPGPAGTLEASPPLTSVSGVEASAPPA